MGQGYPKTINPGIPVWGFGALEVAARELGLGFRGFRIVGLGFRV